MNFGWIKLLQKKSLKLHINRGVYKMKKIRNYYSEIDNAIKSYEEYKSWLLIEKKQLPDESHQATEELDKVM